MHEFAITQSIVDVALETARQHNASSLTEIHLRVGSLTGIVEESLRFYFDAMSRGTPAEGARLVVHPQVAVCSCSACGYSAPADPPLSPCCSRCGSRKVSVLGGDALIIERVEIVLDEAA